MSAGQHPNGFSAYKYRVEGYSVENAPMPDNVPKVEEVGATSAPLTSAAYFLHSHCRDYYDDFMLCKNENNDPAHCLKEGRKVTRCSIDLLKKLEEHCSEDFNKHWNCLDFNNFEYRFCREPEKVFNACVLKKLGYEKFIPGSNPRKEQVNKRENPLY
ncbi:ndufa8, NADH-ubiquinone oxidoreductase complex I 19kd subunit [Entomophthora muscae]|uniref:Ndufa8, NADH-ubiquinone oxidoreductase complex I 19kd subunit n=1 Tax=Entomophthora muscae TaxID=34485 RepID=A0ACC2TPS7_9FUNG|nr:ndufa8, NADH-ubiquinone oxidoreductase complex I 19kd subunit [Entomophthora muscae]